MLFYLFVTFQIIHLVSCDITCYECPIDENTFNYLVTVDRIPDELNNCTTKTTDDICMIDLIWNREPNNTQIALSVRDEGRAINTKQTLSTEVSLENKNNSFIWRRSISYTCFSDECNSLSVLKRLLSSLTLNDNLQDLEYLLKKQEPFDGNYCLFDANTTSLECATGIPPASCQQCSFRGFSSGGSFEVCENCLTEDIGETFLSHEVDFNMTDRTRRDDVIIECQADKCNSANNGYLTRQKVTADFDFLKYFDEKNKSIMLSSMSKIMLIFVVVFFMKYSN